MTKPILKWVGGKTQILEHVLACFPCEIKHYHEPFVGGASVLLGLLSYIKDGKIKLSGNIYASDINANIIGLYQNIQSRPLEFIAEVQKLLNEYTMCKQEGVNRKPTTLEEALTSQESYYYWTRAKFNNMSSEERMGVKGSAMLLFLNKTCFRGVYREGPHGFNVPFGNYKNPGILDEDHIKEVSELIKDVVFTVSPFNDSLQRAKAGDFVYMDPPYAPINETSFVKYNADGFGLDAHKSLFTWCKNLHKKKILFVMSNADVAFVKESFLEPIYNTKIIICRRAINSKNPDSIINEVLITNQRNA